MQALIKRVRLGRGSVMRTYKDAKAMAKSLRDSLVTRKISISHSASLEIVAKQFGFADWNTLSAKMSVEPDHQLGCSFCGKSRHEVRGLFEGGCRNRGAAPCVFICDECVTLCAQIDTDMRSNAEDPQKI
jgi:hypothetical protein